MANFSKSQMALRLVDLPEAEVIRRDLEREFFASPGTSTATRATKANFVTIRSAEVLKRSSVAKHRGPKDFENRLAGKKIVKIVRRGRYLFLLLQAKDSPDEALVIDFSSGGLLRRNARRDALDPNTVIVMGLGGWGQLRMLDTKQGAQMYVMLRKDLTSASPLLAKMGIDPVSQPLSWQDFHAICRNTNNKSLKSLLLDEKILVGVGDIYSDEILFHAELNYRRIASSLTQTEARRLCRSLTGTLHEAVKHRGTTLSSRLFYDIFGEEGGFGSHLEVYQRYGELSSRGGIVTKARFSGRSTYYCDKTQILEEAPVS